MSAKNQQNLVRRPPVVVVMGHIDHGKSTLLDYIRKTKVVASEAGGITQHVGAYEAVVKHADAKERTITFLDTPGHAAFCNIRERGAHAADIAILVVSAEDGVKPQTIEAHKSILKEKIPYIVAITKIDKPNANIDTAKQSLGEHEIYVEGWGGDIPCQAISALTGEGVPELLDMVDLMAELADLTTDPAKSARGTVIETARNDRQGIAATLLLKDGTLKVGEFVVAGATFAPVRFIENFKGQKINTATASMPVRIQGWNEVPPCGMDFVTVASKKEAEKMAEQYRIAHPPVKTISSKVAAPAVKLPRPAGAVGAEVEDVTVPIILKADAVGSLEGLTFELEKIKEEKVHLKIVSQGLGDINENDVKSAQGDPNIHIIGFNVAVDSKATAMIERAPVPIQARIYSIIYDLVEYVREVVKEKIPKQYVEEMTGRAKIMAVFSKEKDKQIVGGKVETGIIETGNDIRLMRRDVEIGRGKIRELQEKKLRAREVAEGHEFGMMVEVKMEVAPGDRIESVRTVEKK